ncbi:RPM1 interacting protein 4, partial [Striga asiatica]
KEEKAKEAHIYTHSLLNSPPHKPEKNYTHFSHLNFIITKPTSSILEAFNFLRSNMDEYIFRRTHIPVFGSWDWDNQTPFTQCFESARPEGHFRYSNSEEERDLYIAGDLYENDVVTPAMIVVPRRLTEKAGYTKEKDCECKLKAPPSLVSASFSTPTYINPPKAVDEDLYKMSPDIVRAKKKRKRSRGFFSSCLRLDCLG